MKQDVTVELAGGKQIKFETGRMAKQASGAALTSSGDNVILATAVASPDPKEGIDFFPLTVEYREFTYAGGRIPGGFIKREGRPSEKEILTSRQIDRPIRPLFPETFRNETQVVAFVYSADKENDPDVLGINGASCALALSRHPLPRSGRRGSHRPHRRPVHREPHLRRARESTLEHHGRRHQGRHRDGGVRREGVLRRARRRRHRVRPRRDQEDLRRHRRPRRARRQDQAHPVAAVEIDQDVPGRAHRARSATVSRMRSTPRSTPSSRATRWSRRSRTS